MANRHPSAVSEVAVVPTILQTGKVRSISDQACGVDLDPDQEAWDGPPNDAYALTWKDHKHPVGSAFIYRAKAWCGFDGKRRLRVQKHHVFRGRVGRRVIILMRVNGETVDGA